MSETKSGVIREVKFIMSTPTPRKKSVKRKAIEEKVLDKARKFVKLSNENEAEVKPQNVPTITMDLVPKVKLRKPRKGKKVKIDNNQPMITSAAIESKSTSKSKSKKKRKQKTKKPPQQVVATPESEQKHAREAIMFLDKWNSDKSEWKFEKLKQIWLLKNALKSKLINDKKFQNLLKYVGSIKGRARQGFLHEMEEVVKQFEVAFPENSESIPSPEEKEKYVRARQLVQMLYDEDSD